MLKPCIQYTYAGDVLGGKLKDENLYIDGDPKNGLDYDAVKAAGVYDQGIARLVAMTQKGTVAVMDYNENPARGHQGAIIGRRVLEESTRQGLDLGVAHIRASGKVEKLDPPMAASPQSPVASLPGTSSGIGTTQVLTGFEKSDFSGDAGPEQDWVKTRIENLRGWQGRLEGVKGEEAKKARAWIATEIEELERLGYGDLGMGGETDNLANQKAAQAAAMGMRTMNVRSGEPGKADFEKGQQVAKTGSIRGAQYRLKGQAAAANSNIEAAGYEQSAKAREASKTEPRPEAKVRAARSISMGEAPKISGFVGPLSYNDVPPEANAAWYNEQGTLAIKDEDREAAVASVEKYQAWADEFFGKSAVTVGLAPQIEGSLALHYSPGRYIGLTPKFFSEDAMRAAGKEYGISDPNDMRGRVMAHEAGHIVYGKSTRAALKKIFANMTEKGKERVREYFRKQYPENHPYQRRDVQLNEIAAEALPVAIGYGSPMLNQVLAKTDIPDLAAAAMEDMSGAAAGDMLDAGGRAALSLMDPGIPEEPPSMDPGDLGGDFMDFVNSQAGGNGNGGQPPIDTTGVPEYEPNGKKNGKKTTARQEARSKKINAAYQARAQAKTAGTASPANAHSQAGGPAKSPFKSRQDLGTLPTVDDVKDTLGLVNPQSTDYEELVALRNALQYREKAGLSDPAKQANFDREINSQPVQSALLKYFGGEYTPEAQASSDAGTSAANAQSGATFTPTNDWQEVSPDTPLPPGLEIRMDLGTGKSYARLQQNPPAANASRPAASANAAPNTPNQGAAAKVRTKADIIKEMETLDQDYVAGKVTKDEYAARGTELEEALKTAPANAPAAAISASGQGTAAAQPLSRIDRARKLGAQILGDKVSEHFSYTLPNGATSTQTHEAALNSILTELGQNPWAMRKGTSAVDQVLRTRGFLADDQETRGLMASAIDRYRQDVIAEGTYDPAAEKGRPVSWREAGYTAEGIKKFLTAGNLDRALAVESTALGKARMVDENGDWTGERHKASGVYFERANYKTGEVKTTLAPAQAGAVMNEMMAAANVAVSGGNLPDDPKAALLTIKKRMDSHIKGWLNEWEEAAKKSAGDDPQKFAAVDDAREKMKNFADEMVKTSLNNLAGQWKTNWTETDEWNGERAVRFNDPAQLEKHMRAKPHLADYIEHAYGDAATAMAGAPTIFDVDGEYYQVGKDGKYGSAYGRNGLDGQNLWGGGIGRALYGAYLAKRMFSMTIGPSIQEAEYYAGKVMEPAASIAATGGTVSSMAGSSAGTATRASLLKDMWARGAYEQWGGFTDASYQMLSGNPWLPRAVSGIGAGLGIAGLGAMAPGLLGTLGVDGLAGLAAAASPVLVGAGVGIAGATVGMEIYNAIPGTKDITWGGLARDTVATGDLTKGRAIAAQKQGEELSKNSTLPGWFKNAANRVYGQVLGMISPESPVGKLLGGYLPSDEEALAELDPQARAFYDAARNGPSPEVQKIQEMAEFAKSVTGEEIGQIAPVMRQLGRLTGSLANRTDAISTSFSQGWSTYGYTFSEQAQRAATYLTQLGYRPGEGGQAFDRYLSMSEDQKIAADERASQIARYGGALGGYFRDYMGGQRFAGRYDLRSQAQVQGLQSLFSTAALFGYSADDQTNSGGTMGEFLAQVENKYGNYRSGLAGQLAAQLVPMGVGIETAFGALGKLGVQNQTQLGAVQGWLGNMQMFGSTANPMAVGLAAMQQNPWQTQLMGGIAQQFSMMSGADTGQAQQMLSGLGMNNQQAWMFSRMAGGDLSAWSWQANMSGGSSLGKFLNTAGQAVYTTDFAGFLNMNNAQYRQGNPWAFKPQGGTLRAWTQNFFGTDDEEGADAWVEGGQVGRMLLNRSRTRAIEDRRLEINQEQLGQGWQHTLQSWGLQDQQRAMQYGHQMEEFGAQQRQMQMQNRFAQEREAQTWQRMQMGQQFAATNENLSWRQMQTQNAFAERGENLALEKMMVGNAFAERGEALSWKGIELSEKYGGQAAQIGRERLQLYHENQLWGLGFAHQTDLMQRGWTQEDWNYQDTTRSLQQGWAAEDINEQIRFATGRQRRQLIKQRDRMTQMNGLEEGQIEAGRERQETMWQREDERYQKQEAFLNKIIELDKQQQEISEAQRLESIALQKEEWRLSKEQRLETLRLNLEDWNLGRERRLELNKLEVEGWNNARQQRIAYFKEDVESFNTSVRQRREAYAEDEANFLRRMKNWQEEWAWQQKIIDNDRAWQTKAHEWQVEELALQAALTKETRAYGDEVELVSRQYGQIAGYWQEMAKNSPEMIIEALSSMLKTMGTVPAGNIEALVNMMRAIAGIRDTAALDQLTYALVQMK